MNFPHWFAFLTLAALVPLQAQTSASAPTPAANIPGPTMEQTISFINEALSKPNSLAWEYENKRGVTEVSDQHVSVSNGCMLNYTYRFQYSIDMESLKRGDGHPQTGSVPLQSADPFSIQFDEERGYEGARSTPPIFHVTIKQPATRDSEAHNTTIGYFTDKDTVQRAGKALIHAMVLCHQSQAPSLF
jgi:hypothetical protein